MEGQRKAVEGQGKAVEGQGKAVEGQGKAVEGQGKAMEGQGKAQGPRSPGPRTSARPRRRPGNQPAQLSCMRQDAVPTTCQHNGTRL